MPNDRAGAFKGTFPEFYDRYLVPMNFAPYARILADRARDLAPRRILETAAGTGIVTRELVRMLPPSATITATDLNQPMIDHAQAKPGMVGVTWQQSDAMKLPFKDASFDLVVCQFGVMFFPDKQAAFREASRVLRPGGTFLFVVWDSLPAMVDSPLVIAARVTGDILGREPFSLLSPPYHDDETIREDLAAAGFDAVRIERISQPSKAASARDAAVVTVQGSMIRSAIEAVDSSRLDEVTDAVEGVMQTRFGQGLVEGATNAVIVTAETPLA